jgi:hypothetical protein
MKQPMALTSGKQGDFGASLEIRLLKRLVMGTYYTTLLGQPHSLASFLALPAGAFLQNTKLGLFALHCSCGLKSPFPVTGSL